MKEQWQILWNRFKPTLKLKKFWLTILSLLSILGISVIPTLQDKLAEVAVQVMELVITTDNNHNSEVNHE